jgi:hypothetical protein
VQMIAITKIRVTVLTMLDAILPSFSHCSVQ